MQVNKKNKIIAIEKKSVVTSDKQKKKNKEQVYYLWKGFIQNKTR